ncbi:MAG: hypothetical protein MJZ03_04955 [archaeon]|nr:hypothetical protein [archaeon]
MTNKFDNKRNQCMLTGKFAKQGYDWWWHSMTAINEETGEEKPFFIEYYVCNPELAQDTPIFGQLPKNKESGIKPSYLMVKVGTWGEDGVQVHRFFPWKDVDIHFKTPFSVKADDCFCSETEMKGSACVSKEESEAHPEYLCEYGDFEWSIKINPKIAFNVGYGAGGFFRALKAFQMFWHAEGMKCLYDGYIKFNGTKYSVIPSKCWGYEDKNWGSDFTTPWVWLSSCDLVSRVTGKRLENSAFDIGGGKPKIGPIALDRKLLGAIFYEGKNYEFNFSKPWTRSKTKFNCYETDTQVIWHVEQKASGASLVTDITCEKKDMIFIKYEAPDGQMRHRRLWNGGNGVGILKLYDGNDLIDEIEAKHVGCEYGEYDKTTPYVSMTK